MCGCASRSGRAALPAPQWGSCQLQRPLQRAGRLLPPRPCACPATASSGGSGVDQRRPAPVSSLLPPSRALPMHCCTPGAWARGCSPSGCTTQPCAGTFAAADAAAWQSAVQAHGQAVLGAPAALHSRSWPWGRASRTAPGPGVDRLSAQRRSSPWGTPVSARRPGRPSCSPPPGRRPGPAAWRPSPGCRTAR